MDEVNKVRSDAISSTNEKGRDARMLESRQSLLKDDLDLLKGKHSTGCGMEIASRRVVDAEGGVNSFVDGLRRENFDSFVGI